MSEDKIRNLIWKAISVHFILTNQVRLSTNLKHEPNKSIAQIMAVGLSNQYNLNRDVTEKLLCIEPSSYDKKFTNFMSVIKKASNERQHEVKDPDSENFFQRYLMCSRYIRKRMVYYMGNDVIFNSMP